MSERKWSLGRTGDADRSPGPLHGTPSALPPPVIRRGVALRTVSMASLRMGGGGAAQVRGGRGT